MQLSDEAIAKPREREIHTRTDNLPRSPRDRSGARDLRLCSFHPVTKNEVLCPRGRANGIGLHKTHSLDGRFQRHRMKERMRDSLKRAVVGGWPQMDIQVYKSDQSSAIGGARRSSCHSEAGFIGEESALLPAAKQQIPRARAALRNDNPPRLIEISSKFSPVTFSLRRKFI